MASSPPKDTVPELYLIKLNYEGDDHYVFTEITASFLEKNLTDSAKQTFKELFVKNGVKGAEIAILPPPGDRTADWSYFAVKRQSGK
ncbi:MAG: hypothetical protein J7493_08335 [Porphyrobacter sp.]|nr:hypothetical protein [Porphyrobacter sp.]